MTLLRIAQLIEESEDPRITINTPIHFIDIDCDGEDPELNVYLDDADRLIIRNL